MHTHGLSLFVCSDVNYLSASAPPAAAEWQSLLRPLRGREPEGMWNLLSIVREMFRRTDSNSIPLLEILTDEVMQCEQVRVDCCLLEALFCQQVRVIAVCLGSCIQQVRVDCCLSEAMFVNR